MNNEELYQNATSVMNEVQKAEFDRAIEDLKPLVAMLEALPNKTMHGYDKYLPLALNPVSCIVLILAGANQMAVAVASQANGVNRPVNQARS